MNIAANQLRIKILTMAGMWPPLAPACVDTVWRKYELRLSEKYELRLSEKEEIKKEEQDVSA
jgi:hypothetical protein